MFLTLTQTRKNEMKTDLQKAEEIVKSYLEAAQNRQAKKQKEADQSMGAAVELEAVLQELQCLQ